MERIRAPFITIYKAQWTSMFSIMERITGIILFFVILISYGLLKLKKIGISYYEIYYIYYEAFKGGVDGLFVGVLLYIILLSIVYHIIFGFRYVYWYVEKEEKLELNLAEYYIQTRKMLAMVVAITTILWIIV